MRYGILGAGSIGAYVGARLALAGHDVTLVGRGAFVEAARAEGGVRVAEPEEAAPRLVPARIEGGVRALAGCERILVTVKATETAAVAAELRESVPGAAPVTSLQNGVRSIDELRAALGRERAFAGMVSFNVVREGPHAFRRTTSGPVRVEGPAGLEAHLRVAGLEAALERDMRPIQWAKLIFNTNNAIVALTGLPLGEAFLDPDARAVYRAAMREGLSACAAAGVPVRGFGKLRPALVARLLALPTFLLRRLLGRMIRVSSAARSSMWEDLQRGRVTEVDLLNGEIARLGATQGVPTPVNAALVRLVRAREGKPPPPPLPASVLRRETGVGGG